MIENRNDNVKDLLVGTQEVKRVFYNSDLVWARYTSLSYIQSDNSGQYIDLGIPLHTTLTPNYDIYIKFNLMGVGLDNNFQATIFNTQSPIQPWPGIFLRKNNNNVQMKKSSNVTVGQLNTDITISGITQYNTQNLTHDYSTTLFCALDSNNQPYRYASGRIYDFKLWNDGVLVRNMVPCKNYRNVVGMYDTVNGVFYTSPNGAAFIAGPEIDSRYFY